jgi:hypothetical protein
MIWCLVKHKKNLISLKIITDYIIIIIVKNIFFSIFKHRLECGKGVVMVYFKDVSHHALVEG